MSNWKKLAGKIFSSLGEKQETSGLFVEVSELLALKQKTAYLKGFNTKYSTGAMAGDIKSAFKGRGMEMEESRAYIFGDDIRDIDWRISARKQQPYTKIYTEERDREVMLLIDMTSSMVFGTRKELKSVTAAKIASLLGWRALENKDRVGGAIVKNNEFMRFKPNNQLGHFASVCAKIANASKEILQDSNLEHKTMIDALQWIDINLQSRAVVFVVSDFHNFDEELQRKLAVIARKSYLYLVHVSDILEEYAPKAGEYMVESGDKKLVFDSGSKLFQKEYHKYFLDKRLNIKHFCNKVNGRYLNVINKNPLVEQLKI